MTGHEEKNHEDTETDLTFEDHRRLLGAAIREVRARRGFSQESLGLESGIHRNYVGAMERGEINPSFRVFLKLVRGLDIPLSALLRLYERNRAADPEARAQEARTELENPATEPTGDER